MSPSDERRIALTFKKSGDGTGLTKFLPPLSTRGAEQFLPDALVVDQAIGYTDSNNVTVDIVWRKASGIDYRS